MASPYRVNHPGGVVILATNTLIFPGDAAWLDYEQWLLANPAPVGGFALVDPPVAIVPTVAEERTEMRARLHAVLEHEGFTRSMLVAGFRFSITRPAVLEYLLQHARTPPFGALRLPDVDGVFHNFTANALQSLIDDAANYHRSLLTWAEAKRATINAAPAPMAVVLNDYPVPP
jgi:hypothetical protein